MKTGCDYVGEAVVKGLTLENSIDFTMALVSAHYALWVCHPQRQLGDALAWFEAGVLACYSIVS